HIAGGDLFSSYVLRQVKPSFESLVGELLSGVLSTFFGGFLLPLRRNAQYILIEFDFKIFLSHPRNRQLQKVAVFTLPNVNFWKRQAESQSTSIHQLKVWRKEVVKQTVKSSLVFCSNECHIVYSLFVSM